MFGISTLQQLSHLAQDLDNSEIIMPAFFMGHGSPMNGIEKNSFSSKWEETSLSIPKPKAIICISAHWETRGTKITAMNSPKTIHDFGGFPDELFNVQYPAPGSPIIAKEISAHLSKFNVNLDHEWGLDHGAWTVIRRMYPQANIPVLQMSIDYTKTADHYYQLGTAMQLLRKKGILFIASGNMVHNLAKVDFRKLSEKNYGYDWAHEMNTTFKEKIIHKDHRSLINYNSMGTKANLAIPTQEHYVPLLYILGMQSKQDKIEFFNDECVGGSLTMTSVKLYS